MRFDLWKYRVDQLLIRNIGLDSDSLDDYEWELDYEAGLLPAEAVRIWMEEHDVDLSSKSAETA